jgi:CRP/FNR family transcriptional regulator, cyclic AMP receptor protein
MLRETPMENTSIEYIIKMPLFDSFEQSELKIAAAYIRTLKVKEKQVIFKEGDNGDAIFFVISGKLNVIKESASKNQVIITTLSTGKSIGEMSIIDETPRSAAVQADCDSILKGLARLLSMNLRKTSSRLADYLLPLG